MRTLLRSFLTLIPLVSAIPTVSRTELVPRAACTGNTATTRNVWCDYDISTNYYENVPDTGVTREYWLNLVNMTLAPDGVSRDTLSKSFRLDLGTTIAENLQL